MHAYAGSPKTKGKEMYTPVVSFEGNLEAYRSVIKRLDKMGIMFLFWLWVVWESNWGRGEV
jgi:hypothetical protein